MKTIFILKNHLGKSVLKIVYLRLNKYFIVKIKTSLELNFHFLLSDRQFNDRTTNSILVGSRVERFDSSMFGDERIE